MFSLSMPWSRTVGAELLLHSFLSSALKSFYLTKIVAFNCIQASSYIYKNYFITTA